MARSSTEESPRDFAGTLGAAAFGALAVGACAIGALAIGRLVIRRLLIGRGRFESLQIGELSVARLRVLESSGSGALTLPPKASVLDGELVI